jgi:hypothetical protein
MQLPYIRKKAGKNSNKWEKLVGITIGIIMRMRDLLLLLPLVAALVITTSPVFATTGMGGGNDDDNPGEGDTHRDLVGNPDEEGEEGSEDDEQDRDGPDGESAEGVDEGALESIYPKALSTD